MRLSNGEMSRSHGRVQVSPVGTLEVEKSQWGPQRLQSRHLLMLKPLGKRADCFQGSVRPLDASSKI